MHMNLNRVQMMVYHHLDPRYVFFRFFFVIKLAFIFYIANETGERERREMTREGEGVGSRPRLDSRYGFFLFLPFLYLHLLLTETTCHRYHCTTTTVTCQASDHYHHHYSGRLTQSLSRVTVTTDAKSRSSGD